MNIWPPFSQLHTPFYRPKVVRGEGVWLHLEDGTKMMDAISSWWVSVHGHAHPKLAEAISKQSQTLEQVIFSAFSHEPAETLCQKLSEKLPEGLDTFFFSDNGSTAVEVALKMCIQYWENLGQKRSRIIAFEGAYHGDTFGAMSVGEPSVFNQSFRDYLFEVDFLPFPAISENESHLSEAKSDASLAKLTQLLESHPDEFACLIVEPLIQGAGGMRMAKPTFFDELITLCKRFNIPVIFDEIMTGFGRTGSLFALDQLQHKPDIVCLSKGLTGGALPLSLTICDKAIAEKFEGKWSETIFYHGHSFTANPLGCAAAVASLEIFEENANLYAKNREAFFEASEGLSSHPKIKNFRKKGFITAFEVMSEESDSYSNSVSSRIKENYAKFGILIRPLGNTVYLMPPYCITPEQSRWLIQQTAALLDSI